MQSDNLLEEINDSIPASDFEAEYYPGGMVKATLTITAELADRVRRLAQSAGWPEADAYVATLASGIGAFEEARVRELQDDESQAAKDEIDLLIKQVRQMEVEYAVMKYRTWNYLQAYQSAALSRGALENRASGLEGVVSRLRAETQALHEEISRLRAAVQEVEAQAAVPAEPPAPAQPADALAAATVWQRISRRRKER